MQIRALSLPRLRTWIPGTLMVMATALIAQGRLPAGEQSITPVSAKPAEAELTEGEVISSGLPVSRSDSGYWFLSTQNSPQSFDHQCPQFCPDVSRYDQCVGFQPSSLQDICSGLEPGVPVCIVIHGSFVDTQSACRESVCVWNWLRSAACGQRMQMIYFSWPSFRPITPLAQFDVNMLGRRAARNGYYLAELIQHFPVECPVCLIGHSHGARVVAAGQHLLAGGAIQGVCHPFARTNGRQLRTVFTAAAVDHNWFRPGRKYDRALCSTQCVLNMSNRADPALAIYPLRLPLIAKKSIGLAGLTKPDRRRMGASARKIVDYDVSAAVGARHLWPYFFNNRSLAMAMRNYVYFPDCVRPVSLAARDVRDDM